jgi:hypothetical protein
MDLSPESALALKSMVTLINALRSLHLSDGEILSLVSSIGREASISLSIESAEDRETVRELVGEDEVRKAAEVIRRSTELQDLAKSRAD